MNELLTVVKIKGVTTLKNGRKTYATVSYNSNPDYKWILWMKGNFALSGFETEELAIVMAQKMFADCNAVIKQFV